MRQEQNRVRGVFIAGCDCFRMKSQYNMNERIRLIRKTLKLNQGEFAKRLGMHGTSLSLIELGENALTEKNIKLVCMTFNVSEDWLRTGNGEMFAASPYEKEFHDLFGGKFGGGNSHFWRAQAY